jgi:hypothetical protein
MDVIKDWKTTLAGLLKVVAAALGIIGVSLSPEHQEAIITAAVIVYTIISAVQSYFTKDKEVEDVPK